MTNTKTVYKIAKSASRPRRFDRKILNPTISDFESAARNLNPPKGQLGKTVSLARILYKLRDSQHKSLQDRLEEKLVKICASQIQERRLSTPTGYEDFQGKILDRDVQKNTWLVASCDVPPNALRSNFPGLK